MATRKKSWTQHLSIEYRPTHSIQLDPKNPRIHSEKQVSQIAQSIEEFGFLVPILVDDTLNVVAGHGRVQAARLLHRAEVPVICLSHLSAAQRAAYMIADNKLTENSTWNTKMLGEQLEILAASDLEFSLEITGFEMAEIDLFIEGLKVDDGNEDDPADVFPDPGPAVSKPSDLWWLGKHRVLCGDALDAASYESLMGSKKADLVFTDPPYNVRIDGYTTGFGRHHHREFAMASGEMSDVEFTAFLQRSLGHAARNSVNGSVHFVAMDWRHMEQLLAAGNAVYDTLLNLCVWAKDNGGMGSLYRSQHELVFVFRHGKESHRNNVQLGRYGRYRTNVWNYPGSHTMARGSKESSELAKIHPTIKPVALVADAILDCSARGSLVLDPFLGSGTTVIAAERTGRVCYGLELDPLYVDTIIRRWQTFTGCSASLNGPDQSFRSVEEAAHGA